MERRSDVGAACAHVQFVTAAPTTESRLTATTVCAGRRRRRPTTPQRCKRCRLRPKRCDVHESGRNPSAAAVQVFPIAVIVVTSSSHERHADGHPSSTAVPDYVIVRRTMTTTLRGSCPRARRPPPPPRRINNNIINKDYYLSC